MKIINAGLLSYFYATRTKNLKTKKRKSMNKGKEQKIELISNKSPIYMGLNYLH